MQNCKPQRQKLCQNPKAVGKQQHRCRLLRCLFVVSPGCADDKNESPGRIPTWKLLSNLKKEIPSLTHRSQRSTHKPLTWILNLVRQCPLPETTSTKFSPQDFNKIFFPAFWLSWIIYSKCFACFSFCRTSGMPTSWPIVCLVGNNPASRAETENRSRRRAMDEKKKGTYATVRNWEWGIAWNRWRMNWYLSVFHQF